MSFNPSKNGRRKKSGQVLEHLPLVYMVNFKEQTMNSVKYSRFSVEFKHSILQKTPFLGSFFATAQTLGGAA